MGIFGAFSRRMKADSGHRKKPDSRHRFGPPKVRILRGRKAGSEALAVEGAHLFRGGSVHLQRQHLAGRPHHQAPGIARGDVDGVVAGRATCHFQRVLVLARRQIERGPLR